MMQRARKESSKECKAPFAIIMTYKNAQKTIEIQTCRFRVGLNHGSDLEKIAI